MNKIDRLEVPVSVKPHKGRIIVEGEILAPGLGLGYAYWVFFLDHGAFAGKRGHTSYVVKDARDIPRHRNDPYEIETCNSRYTVVTEEWWKEHGK